MISSVTLLILTGTNCQQGVKYHVRHILFVGLHVLLG